MSLKSWDNKPGMFKQVNPLILGQPNIPKPLHGINPRTIMGDAAWSFLRQQVIISNPYCHACGLETFKLDLHESYSINYNIGRLEIKEYVPLCKDCHAFIHSGRLTVLLNNKRITVEEVKTLLTRGLEICRDNNVRVFEATYALAKYLKLDLEGIEQWSPNYVAPWNKWHLVYQGKTYQGLTEKQWKQKYNGKM